MGKKSKKTQTKKSLRRRIAAGWQVYVLLLVPLIYLFVFSYIPMGGLVLAFKKYTIADGIWGSAWVGLENFITFFSSYKFPIVLKNTLVLAIYALLVGFPIPILFALLLNAFPRKRYAKVVQSVTYIPHFISTVVMVGIIMQILNSRTGIYGNLFMFFTGQTPEDILSKGDLFKHIFVWSGIWQSTGYNAIIYMAALSSVDQSLHEAACIDGATRFQRLLYVDWPCIRPTAVIMLILAAGGIMNVSFEKALLMQNDLNIAYSEVISTYVYKVGLQKGIGDFSLSTAIGMFNSVINFILLVIVNAISKRLTNDSIF